MHFLKITPKNPLAPACGAGLLLLAAAPRPAAAQAPAAEAPLPIATPPGATVQTEVDARDRDLLGLVKSFLAGATGPAGPAPAAAAQNPYIGLLTDAQITAFLQNVHHLHAVAFTLAPGSGADAVRAFYEAPYEAAGGRRLLLSSGSGTDPSVLMVGFDQPASFAAVVQSAGTVYVVRADGYPDMQVLGKLTRAFTLTNNSVTVTSPARAVAPRARRAPATRRKSAR